MKREFHIFINALTFYTRIPWPFPADFNKDYLNESTRYFPFIGWIIGIMMSLAIYVGILIFNLPIAILFGLAISIVATGAFHEDGFVDVCDGIGGGWSKEDILRIMKDSRIGTFGAAGLILLLLFKYQLLISIFETGDTHPYLLLLLLVSAHSISRFMAMTFIYTHQYVRDAPESKAKPIATQANKLNLIIGFIFALIPLTIFSLYISNFWLFLSIPILYFIKIFTGKYYVKWIGGYTGDCLGASQQISEIAFLIVYFLIWKYS